jgi:PKD repeat protein
MKWSKYLLFSIFISFLFQSSFAQITGDTSVCKGDIMTYYASGGSGYAWSIIGGTSLSALNHDSLVVQWGSVGTGTLSVLVNTFAGPVVYLLNVAVHPKPKPIITHAPYPTCPSGGEDSAMGAQGEGRNCEKVCKNVTLVYSTPFNVGSAYSWTSTGAFFIAGAATNIAAVHWDNSAFGSLTVIETNQWGCVDSFSICIEKVDTPVALFTNQANVCKFSNVPFTNLSTGATSYSWDFGDGNFSTLFAPNYSYTGAGTYTITLIVENDCHCVDTFQNTINVDSLPGPQISCPATLCAGDTATYTASGDTSCTYNWFVIGGAITSSNGTPNITVAWGAGQIGTLGLYITACATVCADTSLFYIPILPAIAQILGPTKVCPGECHTYSLPPFSGTAYQWSIGGSCGTISDSTACEEIEICWSPFAFSCDDTLQVTYYNDFLDCGGTASLPIRLRPETGIYGQNPVCLNDLATFGEIYGNLSNWSISPSGPTLSPPNPSSTVNVDWNGVPGTYTLKAVVVDSTATCNDSSILVVQVLAPPAPPVITGDTLICGNSNATYCAVSPHTVHWIVTGGTPTSAIGNCVSVNWNAVGPYLVLAYLQTNTSPNCTSDTTSHVVQAAVGFAPLLTGSLTPCANTTNLYSTSSSYPAFANYNWSMTPSNSGAILNATGSSTNIEWGNNAPGAVILTLDVELCGITYSSSLSVNLNPVPITTVTQLTPYCVGGTAQLAATGGVSYAWTGPSGFSSAANPTTISNPGLYQVVVTNANGCSSLNQIFITPVSGPTASISSGENLVHCIGTIFADTLCALGNVNYSYLWSTGATTQCIIVSVPGTYTVTVTDTTNNCFAFSNPLTVNQIVCNGTGNPCVPQGSVLFTHTLCNPISFTNTSVNASSYQWNFGDGGSSILTNPTHMYTLAGFYFVSLTGLVPSVNGIDTCLLVASSLVEIPLAAKFDAQVGCFGDATCFTDKSTYTAGNSITSYLWNFGDFGTSGSPNPCHIYATPGTYTVLLTISNGLCTDTFSRSVTILPPPTAAFTHPDTACAGSPVLFTDASIGGVNQWSWNFGDGGSSLNQNPNYSFALAGTYSDSLLVKNIFGCKDSTFRSIVVVGPMGSGSIIALPDTVVCEGETVTLIAPSCPSCMYLWSTGSTNDTILVFATGIYTVAVIDIHGCVYTTNISIEVKSKPKADIFNNGKQEFCLGEYTNLYTNYNPNWTYLWSTTDGVNNGSISSNIFVFPSAAGTFQFDLMITDVLTGCADTSLPYFIIVHPLPDTPVIFAIGADSICAGDSTQLYATHSDPTVTFLWSTGEITDTITITENGCYTVTATDTSGCSNKATYCIEVIPLPDICSFYEGCFDTCGTFLINGPLGATTYQWLMNSSPILGANTATYLATTSGLYSVIVANSFGCFDTTGVLDLNLIPCDSFCTQLVIDSIFCDEQGNYTMLYHVINQSDDTITQINLEILPPFLNLPAAPLVNYQTVAPGASSTPLSTTIYSATAGDTICFKSHITAYDSLGNQVLCCYSDTQCVVLPPCDTTCCYFSYLSDSVWCEQTAIGVKYNFAIEVNGCGNLNIQNASPGILNVSNPYVLTPGLTTLTGSYIAASGDSVLCLSYRVDDGQQNFCVDTTICFPIECPKHPLPCDWEFSKDICEGQNGTFYYFGSTTGLTISWSFPGGSPSAGSGPGLHSPIYNTPGTYAVTMTLTNSLGTTTCTDSISVHPNPVASITQVGSSLQALPAGMSYQWYFGPASWTIISGATSQYYNPTATQGPGYCVVVTSSDGCIDTACIEYKFVGLNELLFESLQLSPNPSNGTFNIVLYAEELSELRLTMINNLGQIVHQTLHQLSSGENSIRFSKEHLAKGVYYIRFENGAGQLMAPVVVN